MKFFLKPDSFNILDYLLELYHKNLAIWIFYFFSWKAGEFWPKFFPFLKNPFYRSKSDFSGPNLAKFRRKVFKNTVKY